MTLMKLVQHLHAHIGGDNDTVVEKQNFIDDGEVSLVNPILLQKWVLGHECRPSPLTEVEDLDEFRIGLLLGTYFL